MRTPDRAVTHVIAGDLPAACRAALETLCENGAAALPARCFHVGPGRIWAPRGMKVVRVHAPLAWPWIGARALRGALRRLDFAHAGQAVILHAWTPDAARYVRWPRSGRLADMPTYVCRTSATQQRLRRLGVPEACTVLIRPHIDLRTFRPDRRRAVRAQLDLGPQDAVVLALPPVARQTGALWAA